MNEVLTPPLDYVDGFIALVDLLIHLPALV